MPDFKNLTGLEKPLTKLVETISNGIGVAANEIFEFDAKKIKRTTQAQAEAERQKIIKKAEGEAEALEILSRASKRFQLEQFSKQINLENIVVKSQNFLKGKTVSDEPVNRDWTARFIDISQDVSREEMQDILAKILAGEVEKPSTFSLKTLDIVKNLGQAELVQFKKFVSLSTPGTGLFVRQPGDNKELQKYELSFASFLHLSDLGFFNPATTLSLEFDLEENQILPLQLSNKVFIFKATSKNRLSLPLLKYTETGMQIAKLVKEKPPSKIEKAYIEDMTSFFRSRGLETYKK